MHPNPLRPFNYAKQDWEDNPCWLFDAYRSVALGQDGGALDPRKLERFIQYVATAEELTDPAKIGIVTDENGKLHAKSGYYAETVLQPFMPLIEAVTDELLELVKVFGGEYVGLKTAEAATELRAEMKRQACKHDLGIPEHVIGRSVNGEQWAIELLRKELRDNVAAIIFRSIRGFAVAEHLQWEHQVSEGEYRQMIAAITAALDKTGINGLARFFQANRGGEGLLETDERTFVPERYKVEYRDGNETGELSEWYPNDREKRKVKRSDFYRWSLAELQEINANPPLFGNWNYGQALLTARYEAIGPEYCAAVKKRNNVMAGYELGCGGRSTVQETHHYATHLGHDLGNEELQELMQQGTGDLSSQKARIIYQVNNLLGALDPRSQEHETKPQIGSVPDPLSAGQPAIAKEPEQDPSRLLPGQVEGECQRRKSRMQRNLARPRGNEPARGFAEPEGNLAGDKQRGRQVEARGLRRRRQDRIDGRSGHGHRREPLEHEKELRQE